MVDKYDVLVVGAGPAGSAAAHVAATMGAKVLVVDRRQRIGVPVRCAEYIPRRLLGELPFGERSFISQAVNRMMTFLPNGDTKEIKAPGVMIQRDRFDQLLADAAREAGAEVRTGLRALGIQDGAVVLRQSDGCYWKVRAAVIVGADGPHSTVGRWIGIRAQRLMAAVQLQVNLIRPISHTEVYFHPRIYGGYGWLFPKGELANVGIGVVRKTSHDGLRETLERFVERLRQEGKIKGGFKKLTSGWIPVAPVGAAVRNNVLLVGDAAGQCHPITGSGVPQAVICGKMAGHAAALAAMEGNLERLEEYETQWQDDYGDSLRWAYERRKTLESNWDRLGELLPYCWVAYREYYGPIGSQT
ncbi:MAG TPA: NAD(P)/FAD-dependent oxidoreductase [Desulfobacterales bacterium]|nr:NAD(P)/FAD-dependent oxidoreductase [Desulfobacterales bacterium]